jgi:tetratricopeptide (TPR) repeat protein
MRTVALGLTAAALWAAAVTASARADPNDPQLNALFHQLFEAPDAQAASRAEANILRVLAQSGSPTADLLLTRGIEAMNRGDFDLSLQTLTSLVRLAPNFAEGWNRRATLHYVMGNLEASIQDIEKALALEPRHFGAWSGLGQIYIIMNRPADALRAFQRAQAAHPRLAGIRRYIDAVKRMDGGRDI